MIKYPIYQKYEDSRCKLLNEDIKSIKELRDFGETLGNIAKTYKVSIQTIYYWCLTEKQRKDLGIRHRERMRLLGTLPAYNLEFIKKSREKKYRLYPEEIRKYINESGKTYYLKNRDKIIKRQLERYYNNLREIKNSKVLNYDKTEDHLPQRA